MNRSSSIAAILVGVVIGGAGTWLTVPTVRGLIENHLVHAPTQEARAKVASILPAYVSLAELTLDGSNGSPFPFRGTVSPQEDLYTASIKRPDLGDMANVLMTTPPPAPLTILTVVNKQGGTLQFYGKVFAEKEVDKWIVGNVNIDSGLQQLGRPKGGFPPGAVISGTPEGDKALADFDTAVSDYKQKAAEALDQQKQAAQKMQQVKEAQLAAYRASLLDAFKAGTSYKGVLTSTIGNNASQPIQVVITEVTGSLVKIDATNPNVTDSKQGFTGTINLNENADPNFYPLTLGPDKTSGKPIDCGFYTANGQLRLRLIDGGLEGSATMTDQAADVARYSLNLQRVSGP